ncbi:LysM peptidoglycan-binding domain-containing protein [Neptuniibacter sp. QD37_6]|uniref:lytic transglycosylase n=1 Tax=Neptuniibacter sp. QD37_6 TaxID=3398210 RepID=UPI0039F53658
MFSSSKSVLLSIAAGVVLSGCQSVTEKNTTPSNNGIDSQPFQAKNISHFDDEAEPTPNDLWEVTRNHMEMELHLDNPRVQTHLRWYKKHPNHMERVVKRAAPYYHHILNSAIERGIPVELALLPIIESAYDPFAYSHGRAAGPWQFIPSTGKYFGLKQNWWYDGRRDILNSTDAAYTYLKKLHKRFDGDWLLALAAYNAGGGNVSKAIRRNKQKDKPTDYWSLNLPKETMAYVPRFLAVAAVVKNSEYYGLTLQPIPNKPHFRVVETGSQIDIAQAATMANISTKELYLLNPGFNRWATAPEGPHRLLVPVENAEQFTNALKELPSNQRVKWVRHKIQSGDSLIAIANKYKTSVNLIRSTNKISGNNIRAGKTLLIPTASKQASEYVLSQQQRHADRQKTISRTTDRQQKHHTVQSGDSFWSIANRYNVGVRQLARWNSMAPGDPLRVGKKLVIWSKPTQTALNETDRQVIRKVGYKVRQGDSLSVIANKFNVNVADILRWNKINKAKYIRPGQHLTLYVDVTRAH